MAHTGELKVIQDFYDFILWLIRHVEKFPRHHRYGLGTGMEQRLQHILALLLRAKFSREKVAHLTDANIELEVLRFQVRLPKDLEVFPPKTQAPAAKVMLEIGSQIGGKYFLFYAEIYKDFPKARQNFLEALSLAPDDMAILNDVGVMYNFFCQYQEAKPYLLKALKVSPGNPDVLKNLAKSYEMTQDYDKAIATYQQMAAQAGPNAYVAYTQIGNIYWLKGDAANARANVTRALALKPDYAPAQKLRAKLPP